MQWTVPDLLARVPVAPYVVAGIAAATVAIVHLSQRPNLNAFPTVGPSSWLGSWWAGIKYMTNPTDHNGAPFKIATLYHWVVIVTKRAHVEELRNARDDELSFVEAVNEDFNSEFAMGSEIYHNPYHIAVLRSQLTRNIGVLYAELRDEIIVAFDEILDLKDNEWKSIPAFTTIQQIVCRAGNRSFVGLPLCRDPDFMALIIQYTFYTVMGGLAIGFFPKFLKPLAARSITNAPKSTRRGVGHLRPIIDERRKYLNEYGNEWDEKPNDLLSWLIDVAGPDATAESLTNCVLSTNLVALYTSSNAFTIALYNLAANPHYVQPLREEVEAIVEKEGWSRTSLSKMRKVDSFLKESVRMEGGETLGLTRKATKDFTFSDGTFIPKGTRINAGLVALHYDDALYENPEVFDPFRFAEMGTEDGQEGAKHQFAATSPEYLAFGHGRHACPGRFFAATELKTMLAHIVTTYDLKLEDNMTRPRSLYIGSVVGANSAAKVMFRRRTHHDGEQEPA
ncbi:cytochrome P450 [Lanmaoa asiatica]|nr:cytochrome P450 [Lanmaoa asiatica]